MPSVNTIRLRFASQVLVPDLFNVIVVNPGKEFLSAKRGNPDLQLGLEALVLTGLLCRLRLFFLTVKKFVPKPYLAY